MCMIMCAECLSGVTNHRVFSKSAEREVGVDDPSLSIFVVYVVDVVQVCDAKYISAMALAGMAPEILSNMASLIKRLQTTIALLVKKASSPKKKAAIKKKASPKKKKASPKKKKAKAAPKEKATSATLLKKVENTMGFVGMNIAFLTKHPTMVLKQIVVAAPQNSDLEKSALRCLMDGGEKKVCVCVCLDGFLISRTSRPVSHSSFFVSFHAPPSFLILCNVLLLCRCICDVSLFVSTMYM